MQKHLLRDSFVSHFYAFNDSPFNLSFHLCSRSKCIPQDQGQSHQAICFKLKQQKGVEVEKVHSVLRSRAFSEEEAVPSGQH